MSDPFLQVNQFYRTASEGDIAKWYGACHNEKPRRLQYIHDELDEVGAAYDKYVKEPDAADANKQALTMEIGDLLLMTMMFSECLGISAKDALNGSLSKIAGRYTLMLEKAKAYYTEHNKKPTGKQLTEWYTQLKQDEKMST